jgi:hypothetical protein
MLEVQLLVTVQVDSDDPRLVETEMESAARQAVHNAMQAADSMGFSHDYVDVASVGYVDTIILKTRNEDDNDEPIADGHDQ